MVSFACDCGGTFRLDKGIQVETFKPYYSESYNVQVNTASEHRAFVKKHGPPLGDYLEKRKSMDFTRKNREEIIAERYAKIGLKYPKGERVTFDEKNRTFIPVNR